jgi:hypothetical protein
MPINNIDAQTYKDAAAVLRGMADQLEQKPEEVVSFNYAMDTTNYLIRGVPFEREYHFIIRTRPAREEKTT